MSFHHLDQFARVDSPITRRAPATRVVATVLVALGAALMPDAAWPQLAALAAVTIGLAAAARIPPRPFLARLLPPFAFVLATSATLLFLAPGHPIAAIGPLEITDAGLLRFRSVAARAAVALAAAVVLVCTTSFPQLVQALRTLRLPTVVTTSLGLAYRFLYILTDEVGRLRRAARSRNAAAGSAPRRRLLIHVAAVALQRSFSRSERVHQAMLGRGYSGLRPTPGTAGAGPAPGHRHAATTADLAALTVLATLVLALLVSART